MKKIVLCSIIGMLVFSSCQKTDLYEGPQQPQQSEKTDMSQENKAKAENVLGFEIPADQDWCLTDDGEVTINVDATVKKVQLFVNDVEIVDDVPDYVTKNGLSLLNQAETNGKSSVTLTYDAPKENLGLYVGFITDQDFYLQKVEGNAVTFHPNGARTRGVNGTRGVTLPNTAPAITKAVESYAYQRKWLPEGVKELLYEYDNYAGYKMTSSDYSTEFKEGFNLYVSSILPNGREDEAGNTINNLAAYRSNGYVDIYGTTKANVPVIVTPVYKYDQPTKYGYEVYRSELYYYYYKNIPAGQDAVKFIQSLPKYKALNFSDCFGDKEDGVVKNHGSYALVYYGDGVPTIENGKYKTTVDPTFYFPEGYKIGFMVRANTNSEGDKKQGEIYADGQLNKMINNHPNFSSSKLADTDQRAVWLNYDGMLLLCWESGTDSDFNDIILEVTGLSGIVPPPLVKPQKYIFCFEDTENNGDFDLNDLVIQGERVDENKVKYTILACGAYDEIKVLNIGNETEVHKLFNVDNPQTFINTVPGEPKYTNLPTFTVTVAGGFKFKDPSTRPILIDLTTGNRVEVATAGQAPHGIMIPSNSGYQFRYPTEKTIITDAYKGFGKWGAKAVLSTHWYKYPVSGKVY